MENTLIEGSKIIVYMIYFASRDTEHFRLREGGMNELGYKLLSNGYAEQTLEIFK